MPYGLGMKLCSVCHRSLQLGAFNRHAGRRDGLQRHCRECSKAMYSRYYAKDAERARLRSRNEQRRAELIEVVRRAKSKPCADCGLEYPYYVMDLDHVRGSKSFTISTLVTRSSVTLQRLEAEIAKCEVVCSNCHRIRTYARQQEVAAV